ncbi:restriction endonuclease subunit S [Lactobacillus delbrueckii]|uniref:restriction endonuclease subunit S n=1 Tax=Lactobacillus delbrueckii TaxID=1584 RepID=UPI000E59A862|nr:restriction endonuclease subunit S [Lactobacillus delbrueckii]RHX67438.1 restriction endonuclease subunit S [Lactobacillus delbrueckii]
MVKMKDSGIEWIGEIPEMWEKVKFNAIYNNRNTKVSDRDYEPLSVTKKGIVPQLDTAAKTNDNDNRKLVRSGDFVINSRSDRRGSCGISSLDGSVSLINTVLEPRNSQIEPLYFDFLFHTVQFADEFYKWGHGIVDDLWTTNWNDMKNITLIFPPKLEQQQIANFLNRKTTEIDGLIGKISAEIENLKQYQSSVITQAVTKGLDPNVQMKDSGIKILGSIPNTWKVGCIKYVAEIFGRIGFRGYTNEDLVGEREGAISLSPGNLSNGRLYIDKCTYLSWEKYYESPEIMINKHDIILVKTGSSFGKVAWVDDINYQMTLNPQLVVLKNIKINKKFLFYALETPLFMMQAEEAVVGGTIPTMSQTSISNFKIVLPSETEQYQIVNYLDQKVAQIQKVIKSKQQQIDQLAEYKNSLIFEYVTGKKQVPQMEGRN